MLSGGHSMAPRGPGRTLPHAWRRHPLCEPSIRKRGLMATSQNILMQPPADRVPRKSDRRRHPPKEQRAPLRSTRLELVLHQPPATRHAVAPRTNGASLQAAALLADSPQAGHRRRAVVGGVEQRTADRHQEGSDIVAVLLLVGLPGGLGFLYQLLDRLLSRLALLERAEHGLRHLLCAHELPDPVRGQKDHRVCAAVEGPLGHFRFRYDTVVLHAEVAHGARHHDPGVALVLHKDAHLSGPVVVRGLIYLTAAVNHPLEL
mmetsp:Transcript_35385/g.79883  ORF Transcript_35385/g.79883 Transcript_35385/m.79883 type:complete len:261 (+) Transcript_35385:50-832(+)